VTDLYKCTSELQFCRCFRVGVTVGRSEKLRQEIATTHGVRVAFGAADLTKPTDATGLIEHATRELDALLNRV
jgi:short-subunit dehydrogenase